MSCHHNTVNKCHLCCSPVIVQIPGIQGASLTWESATEEEKVGIADKVLSPIKEETSSTLKKATEAANEAVAASGSSKESLAACDAIRQVIEQYSWDLPHLVNSLDDVKNYPYDGYFWVKGYGNPGNAGEDIGNRLVGGRTLNARFDDVINVKDYGAVGDGVTDDTSAFEAASAQSENVYVPKGEYFVTTMPSAKLFSNGATLAIDGKTFKLSVVPQAIASFEQTEYDGTKVHLSNFAIGVDAGKNLANSSTCYANLAIGTSAAEATGADVVRLTAIGQFTAKELIKGYSFTAIGTNAGEWTNYADRCLLVGDNAGKNVGSANPVGRHAFFQGEGSEDLSPGEFDTKWPEWREYAGSITAPAEVMTADKFGTKASHLVGLGRNAFGFSITANHSAAVGYDAATSLLYGNDCVAVGDKAMQWTIKGVYSTWVGSRAAQTLMDSAQDTGVGYQVGQGYTHSKQNTVMGYQAMAGFKCANTDTPAMNCFFGRISGANAIGSIQGNSGFGAGTLAAVTGNNNTAVGSTALYRLVTGNNNTAVGCNALILMQDGKTNATALTNATGIGYQARVSGDNQVQLGDSTTTTYAFGAVQDRSDRRDKADIRDTLLGSSFIFSLRPVDFKWDMRDDYIEVVDDGEDENGMPQLHTVVHEKDGSKKRNRYHHGFIAQEVKETMDKLGVDFGGYQDHSVNGGCDVLSLGYEELIAPMIKTIQELNERIKTLEAKVL